MNDVHLVGCTTTLESDPTTAGHEDHFTVARWGHDNSTTAENPRNHAGGDEYWDF